MRWARRAIASMPGKRMAIAYPPKNYHLVKNRNTGNCYTMKKTILAAAVFSAFASSAFAQAATDQPAPATEQPEHSFTGNVAVVTDYRFRGISQTYGKPAIQGGFDYAHKSGFYVGNWNSNVSGNQYPQGASLEMDFYGGYKFEPVKDVNLDVGLYTYYYPGAKVAGTDKNFDYAEIYLAAGYKWFTAKYSYGLNDYFGLNNTTAAGYAFSPLPQNGNSKGSGYLDLNANFDIAEKTTLNLHVGHQSVKHYGQLSYTDYKLGVARDFGFATLGLAVVGTDADSAFYTASNGTGGTKKLGDTTAVLSISKTF
jgi:uncharacterized protein (TIGR02001 family)